MDRFSGSRSQAENQAAKKAVLSGGKGASQRPKSPLEIRPKSPDFAEDVQYWRLSWTPPYMRQEELSPQYKQAVITLLGVEWRGGDIRPGSQAGQTSTLISLPMQRPLFVLEDSVRVARKANLRPGRNG